MEAQEKVLLTRHMILDRWCDVKVTEKNEKKKAKVAASSKIFVARLSATITTEDLKAQKIYIRTVKFAKMYFQIGFFFISFLFKKNIFWQKHFIVISIF